MSVINSNITLVLSIGSYKHSYVVKQLAIASYTKSYEQYFTLYLTKLAVNLGLDLIRKGSTYITMAGFYLISYKPLEHELSHVKLLYTFCLLTILSTTANIFKVNNNETKHTGERPNLL